MLDLNGPLNVIVGICLIKVLYGLGRISAMINVPGTLDRFVVDRMP